MNQNIHRINDIIKQVPDLKYDASTGWFETDRRALYDFAVLVVKECVDIASQEDFDVMMKEGYPCSQTAKKIKQHFGVE